MIATAMEDPSLHMIGVRAARALAAGSVQITFPSAGPADSTLMLGATDSPYALMMVFASMLIMCCVSTAGSTKLQPIIVLTWISRPVSTISAWSTTIIVVGQW